VKLNLPGDRVHSIYHSHGTLLIPWFNGWLMWKDRRGVCVTRTGTFHNCRITGVY
jgi:hypothetical protein